MRRLPFALVLALLGPATALAQSLAVNIDQGARITLPAPAGDVMVGNPGIADVTVLDERHVLLTGKTYGVTNVMISDKTGRTMFSRQVVVAAPDANRVSLYRGPDIYNFACSPRCERTPLPGERDPGPYGQWATGYQNYTQRTKTGQDTASQQGSSGQ
ncbi:MAG TPA: pilus assembly protein N-terminal domain-containing protein [Caulobacteraceae bacterium]|jgi:hypothetical protein|nr:pilus assembly protein N-terminal domain-containing protein [Caulobacteraceae bacterium]